MNKITKGLMVEKLGNVNACYSKKEKKPTAVLDCLGCRPPLIGEKHIGNNETARSLKKFTGQSEQSLPSVS